MARTPAEVAPLVHEAFAELRSGQPRPVGLEIPPDVLQARGEVQLLAAAPRRAGPQADPQAVREAAALLRDARFPVILAGGGVAAAGASERVRQLAERLQAPVVMSDNGRGVLSQRHPLALLNLGGRAVLPHADVVLVVGSRFMDAIARPIWSDSRTRFIYLNIAEHHMQAPRAAGVCLHADAASGLEALLGELDGVKRSSREREVALVKDWCEVQIAHVQPQLPYVMALRQAIPDDGILVSELTQIGYAANFAYPVYYPRTLISAGYQGTLGGGFPIGLGVALGNPSRAVVSISGDGGFGWGLQELSTLAKYRANLVTVIFADGAFGNVRRIQNNVFKREIGTELCNPDFVKLAEAFGLQATSVVTPDALGAAVASALRAGGPAVIEVPVGEMSGPWHLIHTFSKAPRDAPANPLGLPE